MFGPQIEDQPASDLYLSLVIPAYNEPSVLPSLQAIKNCQVPEGGVEVVVVFNDSAEDDEQVKERNASTFAEARQWAALNSTDRLRFYPLYFSGLPPRHAGVGLARKIGMDEACRRLCRAGTGDGIVVGFDADSLCENNYLVELERHFRRYPEISGCSIYFEHPLEGNEYPPEVYRAIVQYELHLRYYINAQRFAGFPAFQTIGSSMAVRSKHYMLQGGMNRRKAGEDFYFLCKFIQLGNFTELNTTAVRPSPRISDRVPFGTGKAIKDLVAGGEPEYRTYSPDSFIALSSLPVVIPGCYRADRDTLASLLYSVPEGLRQFLEKIEFVNKMLEINQNTTTQQAFRKRVFHWFNAFQVMKYLHYVRQDWYPEVPVVNAAASLLDRLQANHGPCTDARQLLCEYRKYDRSGRAVVAL